MLLTTPAMPMWRLLSAATSADAIPTITPAASACSNPGQELPDTALGGAVGAADAGHALRTK
jgi:hypothetical protein